MSHDSLCVPFVSYRRMQELAERFRSRFAYDDIVYPIEMVADVDLKLDVVPMVDLRKNYDTNGLLSADMKTILVDDYMCNSYEDTYRFTLAHELAHVDLHRDLWTRFTFRTPTEWREQMDAMFTSQVCRDLQWQADAFASLVLVPARHLRAEFDRVVDVAAGFATEQVCPGRQERFDLCYWCLYEELAKRFCVPSRTAQVRCDYDGLADAFAQRLFGNAHGLTTRRRFIRSP